MQGTHKMINKLLRFTVSRLKRLYLRMGAYEYHRLATRSASELRLHTAAQLKDIGGLTRGTVSSACHAKCPICHTSVWNEWIKGA